MLLPDWSPLRSRDFRLLYFGQLISGLGSALTYVVLPIQMYQLTQSTVMVGLLGVAEFVPMLTVAFAGGILADRMDRRKLVMTAETLMVCCVLVLVANAWSAMPRVAPLFVVAALLAGLSAAQRPALAALTPQLLTSEQMTAAGALATISGSFATIAAPGFAGWLAIRFGAGTAFAIDAASYGFSLAAVWAIRAGPLHGGAGGDISWHSLVEGWRYAWTRRDIAIAAAAWGLPSWASACRIACPWPFSSSLLRARLTASVASFA